MIIGGGPGGSACALALQKKADRLGLKPQITIIEGNGAGYAATGDLTEDGIRQAIDEARRFARLTAKYPLVEYAGLTMSSDTGEYRSNIEKPLDSMTFGDKIDLAVRIAGAANTAGIIHKARGCAYGSFFFNEIRKCHFKVRRSRIQMLLHILQNN